MNERTLIELNVNKKFIYPFLLILTVNIAKAQNWGTYNTQAYLNFNKTQQINFLERLSKGQKEMSEACVADMSITDLREYFNRWIDEHPSFYSKEVVLSFSAAILDRCKAEKTEGKKSRFEKIEEGGWTVIPYLTGDFMGIVFNDYTFKSTEKAYEINDLYLLSRTNMYPMFSRQLYLEIGIWIDPTDDQPPGNRTFEDHGLYIPNLELTWEREYFWISVGKGQVNHGIAAFAPLGNWGPELLMQHFSVLERVGITGNIDLGNEKIGFHSISGIFFKADNSFLSRDYFTNDEVNSIDNGGPSNTNGLNSYALTIDGSGFSRLNGFRYHISGMKQGVDRVNDFDGEAIPEEMIGNEYRAVAAIEWSGIELHEDITLTPLLEYGQLWNARGVKDLEEQFTTASVILYFGSWHTVIAGTSWIINGQDYHFKNGQFQVSGGYTFDSNITLAAGYRYLKKYELESHTLGILFFYGLPFGS